MHEQVLIASGLVIGLHSCVAVLKFFVNHDLARYEVPVHADIPHQEVIFLDETDPLASPMKAKASASWACAALVRRWRMRFITRRACGSAIIRLRSTNCCKKCPCLFELKDSSVPADMSAPPIGRGYMLSSLSSRNILGKYSMRPSSLSRGENVRWFHRSIVSTSARKLLKGPRLPGANGA